MLNTKSITLKKFQAESELAEAMAALREETDRVAHIESTITSNLFFRKIIYE